MIGTFLGQRYRITRLLGKGGMGAVYAAEDTRTERIVAVKLITGDLAHSASLLSRFEVERKAAAAIDSPHIARFLDSGSEDGSPFMVMEYLEGEDLGELLTRLGPLSQDLALRLVAQACQGLSRAHEAGIVHRDIKPANLFLARRGESGSSAGDERVVKLLDFGVAKLKLDWATSAEAGGLTRTGAMLGSPLYMAPEQARGGRSVDHRADIWSLGIVLYRALTGHVPNENVAGLGELIITICTQPPRAVQRLAPWVSSEVAAIVEKSLTLDPAQRYQSADQVLAAIRPLITDFGIRERDLVPISEAERTRPLPPLERTLVPPEPTAISVKSPVPSARSGPLSTQRPANGARILLVEDNEMNMDMLARRLERKGYQVLRAVDGETGVSLAMAERPDLILMDISLPGMDGWEATRLLRAGETTHATPIIALTAHAMTSARHKAFEVGCNEYETKPVEFTRLLAKIEAQLAPK